MGSFASARPTASCLGIYFTEEDVMATAYVVLCWNSMDGGVVFEGVYDSKEEADQVCLLQSKVYRHQPFITVEVIERVYI